MGEVENGDIFPLVKNRADALDIKTIVVSTISSATGFRAAEIFKGYNVVVVTHSQGFREKDKAELQPE